ncbi:Werner Syndrome-like exonuclease [Vitis vinifera]|uniref:3'-5' exonuclease n=1 Tax=Vitis vinifera TaxID=29760 RepID=A0A438ISZ8_VITVI|nr:Werner Syndrome-like exonuclease [Vitis vinifera]
MQICGGNSHCYVMHIIHSGIPRNLQSLLEDPTSIKVGVGIANDAVKVFKDHSVSVKDLEDLSYLANQKLGGDAKKWGLGSLTEMLISKQVNSMYLFANKIRLGNWEADVLSKAQLEYAATDAFASWYLYEVLKSFPDTAENKIEELEGVSICLYNLSEANVCSSGDLKCETSVLLMGCLRVHRTVALCASFGGSLAASLILVG